MAAFYMKAVAFVATCLLLATLSNTYTMENMCTQWSGKGYIGNPTDCTGWGYCQGQKLVSWGNCGSGLVFDSQTSTCQPNTKMACSTSVQQTCNVLTTPGFMADPTDCTKYAYCFGNGKYETKACPKGQQYAANNNTCVWGPNCPQDTICRFMSNNIYVGDPNNCGQYLQCIKGYGIWGQCQDSKFYNAALGLCQSSNPCEPGGPSTPTEPGLPPPTSTVCATADTYTSDGKTCYGFYYCDTPGTGAVSVWGACPFGTEFNSATQKCVSPAALACTFDRCANTNLTYAAIANTNCQQYTYCPNNTPGQCQGSFPYYDEVNGKCVNTMPPYAICKPT